MEIILRDDSRPPSLSLSLLCKRSARKEEILTICEGVGDSPKEEQVEATKSRRNC